MARLRKSPKQKLEEQQERINAKAASIEKRLEQENRKELAKANKRVKRIVEDATADFPLGKVRVSDGEIETTYELKDFTITLEP